MMKRILLLLILAFALSSQALAAERCDNCRMKVADDSRYKVTLTLKGGGSKLMCSIFCASIVGERLGAGVTKMTVVDYLTGDVVEAHDAAWVEESDARPMMSSVSRIAFKDAKEAAAFVHGHGGHVASFDEVYKNSVAEWKGK